MYHIRVNNWKTGDFFRLPNSSSKDVLESINYAKSLNERENGCTYEVWHKPYKRPARVAWMPH